MRKQKSIFTKSVLVERLVQEYLKKTLFMFSERGRELQIYDGKNVGDFTGLGQKGKYFTDEINDVTACWRT